MSDWIIYCIGFIAQILFSSRLILQWLQSEKQKRVVVPTLFWLLSLSASILLFIYGYLRHDFAILFGQVLTYFIYIRNLQLQKQWQKAHITIRYTLLLLPVFVILLYLNNSKIDVNLFFKNEDIPRGLLVFGIVAQTIFTLRFTYQWFHSEKRKKSILPKGFWVLSLTGSILILIYAIYRKDPVLCVGHTLGSIVYIRNLMLLK